ncbi:MAG: alpha-ketoglutarate-dependent dioxygenase AlkB [Ginsengibacter sp.]
MNLFPDTEFFNAGIPKKIVYTLQDADLIYIENFFSKETADSLYKKLLNHTNWLETKATVYGTEHNTPRLTAWYGDAGTEYTFSGNKMHPFSWTDDLLFIKEKVDKESGVVFNSVLLNLYRNGKDSVGWHRDNEKEFGTNPVITSVSFGETRPFHLKHKFKKDQEKVIIPLTHGSLLIMKGKTQHYWEHQVPKTAKDISPRINLTFRVILKAIGI